MTDSRIHQFDEDTWYIEDSGVRIFVLTGTEKALVIDSGRTIENLRPLLDNITPLPKMLVNTHADPDHIHGNREFNEAFMHPAEFANYHAQGHHGLLHPLWEGDILDLGGREIEVLAFPGHTPGSIAFLDSKKKYLFSGDPIQDGQIYLFGPYRDILAFYLSLKKAATLSDRFNLIFPSHGTLPVEPSLIPKLIEGCEKLFRNELIPTQTVRHDIPVLQYYLECAVFLCDLDPKF